VKVGKAKGLTSGIGVGNGSLKVTLLQFVDDTLFFLKDSYRDCITLKLILRCFKMASGLKVNFFKSNLAGIHVRDADVAR